MWLRMVQLKQGFGTGEMGFNGAIAGQQFQTPMSPTGQKRRFDRAAATSGLPLSTDILTSSQHVAKVPISEVASRRLITSSPVQIPRLLRLQPLREPRSQIH